MRTNTIVGRWDSEATLSELTESLPESIFEADLQGKLTYANQVLCETFGYTTADLDAGLNILQILDSEDGDSAKANLLGSVGAKMNAGHEYTGLRQDGTRFPVAIHSTVIHQDTRPVGLRGFIIDISERRHLEKELRQAQKMEAIGHLAGGIAHDSNNLLTAIIGHTELALRRMPRDTPVADDLGKVLKVSDRAAELTTQLLAYARRQPLESRVINLNSLIMQTSQMLARVIGEDVALRFAAHAGLGNVRGDPGQIEQVLMNLAVNARDAMPEGGSLAIETANVMVDEEEDADQHPGVPPGSYVTFAVSDTGCGMDDETQKRIFEPFFTTKEVGSGTGLGLSTVYGIVKQHEGNISVYSEVGQGACFKVYLPRVDEEVQAEVPEGDAEALPRGCETILVVEDDETVRSVVGRQLQQQGYNVLLAAGAEVAEKLHEEHESEIMLLLTDVVMPGCNGYELYRRVTKKQPSLKVMFMSGYTGQAIEDSKLPYGAFPFMQKPFDQAELARTVRRVLDS